MMELRIGNYLVKLEAAVEREPQIDRTRLFLCDLSNAYFEARDFNDQQGYYGTARERLGMAMDVHAFLESIEYFAEVREKVHEIMKEEAE